MKTIRLILLLAVAAGIWTTARAADRAQVEGLLIVASSEPGQTDRRLAPYEATLRRVLRFESFKLLGSASGAVDTPGERTLTLGSGHELEVQASESDGKAIHVKVRWSANGRALMNTGLVLRAGVPAVLGGPSTGRPGEAYAVILIGR